MATVSHLLNRPKTLPQIVQESDCRSRHTRLTGSTLKRQGERETDLEVRHLNTEVHAALIRRDELLQSPGMNTEKLETKAIVTEHNIVFGMTCDLLGRMNQISPFSLLRSGASLLQFASEESAAAFAGLDSADR